MAVTYTTRINKRAKGLRLAVYPDGRVVVTMRSRWYAPFAEQLVHSKTAWIQEKLAWFVRHPRPVLAKRSRAEITHLKRAAKQLAAARLVYFNQTYGFSYQRITIRDQRTRWGSCSRRGTLSFNYRIALLPPELADYVVVHELCHLGAFNHSRAFWQLMARVIPDYKIRRVQIKKMGLSL